jgi:uncharacterized protein (TIGR02145 family)
MAENMNYKTGNSWCYDNKNSNCDKYGRLYDWETAMNICPSGWHLPSGVEWNILYATVGGFDAGGKKLKAENGWADNGNGSDNHGFSALPGGIRCVDGSFRNIGNNGYWWTASSIMYDHTYHSSAYGETLIYNRDYARYRSHHVEYYDKRHGFSVRCVADG